MLSVGAESADSRSVSTGAIREAGAQGDPLDLEPLIDTAERGALLFTCEASVVHADFSSKQVALACTERWLLQLDLQTHKIQHSHRLDQFTEVLLTDYSDDVCLLDGSGTPVWLRTSRAQQLIEALDTISTRIVSLTYQYRSKLLECATTGVPSPSAKTSSPSFKQRISSLSVGNRLSNASDSPSMTPRVSAKHRARRTSIQVTNVIRGLVSKKKRRYKAGGYDLDLTYITEQVLAMGFPSEDVEGLYRNPYSEVYRFFQEKHSVHYKIYNLCSEKSYAQDRFDGRFANFPFDDHNVPELQVALDLCHDVHSFLYDEPFNTVAIHCKAGKGRSGTMIAAYLLYSGVYDDADTALDFFGTQRTTDGKGVTIPSQKRFVRYFQQVLRDSGLDQGARDTLARPLSMAEVYPLAREASWVLRAVEIMTVPRVRADQRFTPGVRVYDVQHNLLFDSLDGVESPSTYKAGDTDLITMECEALLPGLGMLRLVLVDSTGSGSGSEIAQFWFEAALLDGGVLALDKTQVDWARKDKKHKRFDSGFGMRLRVAASADTFELPGAAAGATATIDQLQSMLRLERAKSSHLQAQLDDVNESDDDEAPEF